MGNRYTLVKPYGKYAKVSDEQKSSSERSGFSIDSIREDSLSSKSSHVVDSQITTSAEKSNLRSSKRKTREKG